MSKRSIKHRMGIVSRVLRVERRSSVVRALTWCSGTMLAFSALLASSVSAQQVAHWTFNSTSGATASELVAGADGALIGFAGDGSEWVPGVLGYALEFDGIDDHVSHTVPLPRPRGTLAHWLWVSDTSPRVAVYESDSPAGATDYNGFGNEAASEELHSGANNAWQFHYQDGPGPSNSNGRYSVSGGPFEVNRWTQITVTWDEAGDLILYVDCVEVDRRSLVGGTFDGRSPSESFFGRPSLPLRYWKGKIDDVRIFDFAFAPSSVRGSFCGLQKESQGLAPDPLPTSGAFGRSLALEGDLLVVGDPTVTTVAGRLHLYRRGVDGNFVSAGALEGPTPSGNDRIGFLVDHDGDSIVTTVKRSPGVDDVLATSPSGRGSGVLELVDPPMQTTDQFAEAISVSGDWLAVGQPSAGAAGRVFLYRWSSVEQEWQLEQTLEDPLADDGGRFGFQVALALPFLAVSAPFADGSSRGGAAQAGRVWVYELDGGTWVSHADFEGLSGSLAGTALDLDPPYLAVGMPYAAAGGLSSPGVVRVYELLGDGSATEETLRARGEEGYEYFGNQVALHDGLLAVATRPQNGDKRPTVAVYRYGGGLWNNFDRRLVPSVWDAQNERFGEAIALGDKEAVVGAWQREQAGNSVGSAFVFPMPIFLDDFESGTTAAWSNGTSSRSGSRPGS